MSNNVEPIPMDTQRTERLNAAKALLKTMNESHEKIMAGYNEIMRFAWCMKEDVKKVRELAMKCECPCGCECKSDFITTERKLTELFSTLKTIRLKLFHSKQVEASILVDKLHAEDCKGTDDCLLEMQRVLTQDPLSLERKRERKYVFGFSNSYTCDRRSSPLHDAIYRGHVKCVQFLLERGARVTSLTTYENDTVLHTLYDVYATGRLEILQLLLQYGVSCMFQHNQAGEYALKAATTNYRVEDVSLLLQHGATMCEEELQTILTEAWKMYDLSVIKLYVLHYSKRSNFGVGDFEICFLLVKHCYKQMVATGVLLHLCHEKLLEALQFYKVLGGKFHGWTEDGSNQDLMQYLKSYKHGHHFNGVENRIEELVSNPMSLKEISRLAVRKCIIIDYVESIKKLEVPVDLHPFLRFDDVIITDYPDNYAEYPYSSTDAEDDGDNSDMEF